jgi:hypothetical protein
MMDITFFITGFQTGSGAHPVSYPVDTRDTYPSDKAAGTWKWPLTSI